MKITYSLSAALLAVAVSGPLATAQTHADTTSVATASTTSAPAAPVASGDLTSEPATIDHVVYLARLPAPGDLVKAAETQGVKIARMDQTGDKIVVVYQYSGGRMVTFAYTLLSAAGASAPIVPAAPAPASGTTIAQVPPPSTPTVVQAGPPPRTVYYYDDYYYSPRYVRYYDPAWDFWAPLAVGVGLGWAWHGGGGHYYHGGGGWHHGGGGWRH